MIIKKISSFLLIMLVIWSTPLTAAQQPPQQAPLQTQVLMERQTPMHQQIAAEMADDHAQFQAEFESEHHWEYPKGISYKQIYDQEYREEYARLVRNYKPFVENWEEKKRQFENRELTRRSRWVKELIGGKFTYTMTPDEIRQELEKKFMRMKQRGRIISRTEYEAMKHLYINHPTRDLTRIWGADYIRKEMRRAGNGNYDTPDYVIVTDDPNAIKIGLDVSDQRFPIAKLLLGNAFIDFVKIRGTAAGYDHLHGPLRRLGFVDLGPRNPRAIGNVIIERTTGKYYVVDTEMKSFDHRRHPRPFEKSFAYYAYEKFRLLFRGHVSKVYTPGEVHFGTYIPITLYLEEAWDYSEHEWLKGWDAEEAESIR